MSDDRSSWLKTLNGLQCGGACFLIVEPTLDQPVQPVNLARAADGDELDLARVARLEADRGAGGDVQPHAVGRRAIECEGAVHLEEMKMRSDLDRTIAAVADVDSLRRTAGVQFDGLGCE